MVCKSFLTDIVRASSAKNLFSELLLWRNLISVPEFLSNFINHYFKCHFKRVFTFVIQTSLFALKTSKKFQSHVWPPKFVFQKYISVISAFRGFSTIAKKSTHSHASQNKSISIYPFFSCLFLKLATKNFQ